MNNSEAFSTTRQSINATHSCISSNSKNLASICWNQILHGMPCSLSPGYLHIWSFQRIITNLVLAWNPQEIKSRSLSICLAFVDAFLGTSTSSNIQLQKFGRLEFMIVRLSPGQWGGWMFDFSRLCMLFNEYTHSAIKSTYNIFSFPFSLLDSTIIIIFRDIIKLWNVRIATLDLICIW